MDTRDRQAGRAVGELDPPEHPPVDWTTSRPNSDATTYRLTSHFTETADAATFEPDSQPKQAAAALAGAGS